MAPRTKASSRRSAKTPEVVVDTVRTTAEDGSSRVLPLVALRETVIFPEMIVPLQVGRDKSVNALNQAVADGSPIALVTQRQADREDITDPSELAGAMTDKLAELFDEHAAQELRSASRPQPSAWSRASARFLDPVAGGRR